MTDMTPQQEALWFAIALVVALAAGVLWAALMGGVARLF